MIDFIYIERDVADHPRVKSIRERFPKATPVSIDRYGEILNRRGQNFRLQKRNPALILAAKFDGFVLDAPPELGIGGDRNYYFAHMLNCVYDCRYCFLQGMFQSAAYVLFVNYEEFQSAIERKLAEAPGEEAYFFSGYDCDSLALEPVTGFAAEFVPFFERLPGAWLELRTKSVQIQSLLDRPAAERCVVAFSFTPEPIGRALERGVPSVAARLGAMARLQSRGWKLGLRFDPLIYTEDYRDRYRELFQTTFDRLDADRIHSISLGPFRLPRGIHKEMVRLMPDDRLLAGPLTDRNGMVSYPAELEEEVMQYCAEQLLDHVPEQVFFPVKLDVGPVT